MKLVFVLLVSFGLLSCASKTYTYKIVLQNPVKSTTLYYQNDTLSISFDFTQKAIFFKLYNKFEDGIKN